MQLQVSIVVFDAGQGYRKTKVIVPLNNPLVNLICRGTAAAFSI
jgi:hypothetical protein